MSRFAILAAAAGLAAPAGAAGLAPGGAGMGRRAVPNSG